jgi:hypothetical protein
MGVKIVVVKALGFVDGKLEIWVLFWLKNGILIVAL